MTQPNDGAPPPVLLAATEAGIHELAAETRSLHATVRSSYRLRRVRWIIAAIVGVGLWVNAGLYWRQSNRTATLARENHRLLVDVENVTGPKGTAAAAAAQTQVVTFIVTCVENHVDHALAPLTVPIRKDCPQP